MTIPNDFFGWCDHGVLLFVLLVGLLAVGGRGYVVVGVLVLDPLSVGARLDSLLVGLSVGLGGDRAVEVLRLGLFLVVQWYRGVRAVAVVVQVVLFDPFRALGDCGTVVFRGKGDYGDEPLQRQPPVSGIFIQDPALSDTFPSDDVIEVHGLRTAPPGDVGGNEVVREEFCQQTAAASAVGVVGRREDIVRLVLGDGQCRGRGRDGLVSQ